MKKQLAAYIDGRVLADNIEITDSILEMRGIIICDMFLAYSFVVS